MYCQVFDLALFHSPNTGTV